MTFDDEYRALHTDAVWMDRSTSDARLDVRGPDAAEWLQGLLTQEVKALQPGQGAYAAYLTPQGRMVADLRVLRRDDSFIIEAVAPVAAALLTRLEQFVIMEDVTIADVSGALGCLTVIGPSAAAAVAACTGVPVRTLDALPEYGHVAIDDPNALVAASRAFGVAAFDLIGPRSDVETWRSTLLARIPEASLDLLDTARIEAGRPRFGVDMHEDTIPLEAGIESRAIDFDKGCYVGQEVVIRILHRGQGRVARRLVWIVRTPVARDEPGWSAGDAVFLGDKQVGVVSSACWSPARGGLLAIAMVHRDATEPGTAVRIGTVDALVERLP